MTYKVLDLFSGIGGFSIGLERTGGFETVAFCEIEKFPQKVLAKHWPKVPIYEDVKELTYERLKSDGIFPNVITGGFPCTDISVAGKQAGIGEGTRSGLWSECARLVGEIRPDYAIFENVTALLSGDNGRWFQRVLFDLSALGYDAEWHCIPASELGAHHHRDRVWIIAYPSLMQCHGGNDNAGELLEGREVPEPGNSCGEKDVADAERQRQQGQGEHVKPLLAAALKDWKAIDAEPGCISGIWSTESELGRVANGIPAEMELFGGIGETYRMATETEGEITESARCLAEWEVLRKMWENRDIAEASPKIYFERLHDCVPEMSCQYPQGGWFLGAWIENDKGLRDLWESFYSEPFQEAQNLQQKLLERIRENKRTKKVGPAKDRSHRLKSLGNAVVPQIPELIGRAILEAEQ